MPASGEGGDERAGVDLHDLSANVELGAFFNQDASVFAQLVFAHILRTFAGDEQRGGGQLEAAGGGFGSDNGRRRRHGRGTVADGDFGRARRSGRGDRLRRGGRASGGDRCSGSSGSDRSGGWSGGGGYAALPNAGCARGDGNFVFRKLIVNELIGAPVGGNFVEWRFTLRALEAEEG
jgi:hypothetical protein